MWYLISLAFLLLINYKCVDSATESAISLEEFENLKATVNRLEKMAESQSILNIWLESVIEKQDRKIQDLQETVSRCVELRQRQENNISSQSKQMRQLTNFIGRNQRHKNSEDNIKIFAIQRRYVKSASKVKRYEPNTVAFFATVSVKSLDHLGFYKNIVFDSIVTNIGNGYNNYQGVFTAPISGLYLFTTSLMSNHNMEFWVNFVVNRTIIARLNERGTDGRHGSGSQTIILSLNKGDDVAVQNEHNNGTFWGDKYSSFGGYLIQELESETSSIIG